MYGTEVKPKGAISTETGNGTDIYINTSENEIEGKNVPLGISIGHEEGHASRFDKWVVNETPESEFGDPNSFEKFMNYLNEVRVTEEKEASHIENKIRAEYDPKQKQFTLREKYSNIRQNVKNPVTGKYEIKQIDVNVIKDGYRYYKNSGND